jgi:hypothetical protein
MISKKYYKWIAKAIKRSLVGEKEISLDKLIAYLDGIFIADNRDFNLTQFLLDCNLEIDLRAGEGLKRIEK